MKFMIAVDCEGVACVVGNEGRALSESSDFAFARKQATKETNAAARYSSIQWPVRCLYAMPTARNQPVLR